MSETRDPARLSIEWADRHGDGILGPELALTDDPRRCPVNYDVAAAVAALIEGSAS